MSDIRKEINEDMWHFSVINNEFDAKHQMPRMDLVVGLTFPLKCGRHQRRKAPDGVKPKGAVLVCVVNIGNGVICIETRRVKLWK